MSNNSKSRAKKYMNVIGWAVIAYTVYCIFLFLLQRSVLFPTQYTQTVPGVAQKHPRMEILWLDTGFGRVESWFMPADPVDKKRPSPLIIYAHGNAELIDLWPHEFSSLNRMGVSVLLVEYPGYGRSAGSPSQKSITEAFVSAYDRVSVRPDVDASRIILFGRSLGGGAVCALSRNRPVKAIILMSTFTSVRAMAKRYLTPGFLVRDPFDNRSALEKYPGPVLIFHGKYDTVIPYTHGKSLSRAARNVKLITYQAGHNDCPPDWDLFWQDVKAFLLETGSIRM